MRKSLLLLCIVFTGCAANRAPVADSVYFTPHHHDTVVIVRKQRWVGGIGEPFPTPYYYPMGGWNVYEYRYEPAHKVKVVGGRSGEKPASRRRGRD